MPFDKWVEAYAKKVEEGTANRPKYIQDPRRTYTGNVLTASNYQPTTPALQPEQELAQQENYGKLAPWEKWLAGKLPGFTQSSVGKALTWFGGTWAGKVLSYLDIAAEGVERLTGLGWQALEARKSPQSWNDFTKDLGAAWYASSLTADMANLPDIVSDPVTGYRLVIPTDLPGIRGLVEARQKISGGTPLEQVREEYYNNVGALALRSQYQDLIFHVVADPLNYVLPYLKPVEKIKAAGISLRTYRASDDFIDMTRGLAEVATTKLDELTDALKVAEEAGEDVSVIEKLQKAIEFQKAEVLTRTEQIGGLEPLSQMTLRERAIYKLTGGDMLAPDAGKINFLGKSIGVWNPFGLTPSARAHEYVNVLTNGIGNYVLSKTDDVEKIAGDILDAYKGATGNALNHFFMTPEGAAVQGAIADVNQATQELYGAWKLFAEQRDELATFAKALDMDVYKAKSLLEESPAVMAKRLMDKGIDVESKHLDELLKHLEDLPLTKMEWKYKLNNTIQDIAAKHAVIRYGVKARGFIEKSALALKTAETLAFLRLNPGYVVRNFLNNEFTMIARGLGGNFTGADVEKFVTEILKFEPVRYGQAFTMVGEGALEGTLVGTTVIEDALRGDIGTLDKIADTIKKVNLGKFDMGEAAQKVEKYASQRAYLKGYMEGWRKYFWKPDAGYDSISKFDSTLKASLDEYNPTIAKYIERAIRDAFHEQDIDNLVRGNLELSFDNILGEASRKAGFNIEDVIEPEFLQKIRAGIQEAVDADTIEPFMNRIRGELEGHLDLQNLKAVDHYRARTVELIKAEGAKGYASIVGDLMDEFWGAHDVYIDHMKELSVLDSIDPSLTHKFWDHLEQRNSRFWKRQFDRLDAAAQGIREGAEEAGLRVNPEIYDRLDDWKNLISNFYQERTKLRNRYFGRRAEGKQPTISFLDMQAKLDKNYEKLIQDEHRFLGAIDSMIAEHLPITENGLNVRELFVSWRDAIAQLRKGDKEKLLAFRRSNVKKSRTQIAEDWAIHWQERQTRMEQIRATERLGFRAMEGDEDAIQVLINLANQKREKYQTALSIHEKIRAGQPITPEEALFHRTFLEENESFSGAFLEGAVKDRADIEAQINAIRASGFKPGEYEISSGKKLSTVSNLDFGASRASLRDAGFTDAEIDKFISEGLITETTVYPTQFTEVQREINDKLIKAQNQLTQARAANNTEKAAELEKAITELENKLPRGTFKGGGARAEQRINLTEEGTRAIEAARAETPRRTVTFQELENRVNARKKQDLKDLANQAYYQVEDGQKAGPVTRIQDSEGRWLDRDEYAADDPMGKIQAESRADWLHEDKNYVSFQEGSTFPSWYSDIKASKDTILNQLKIIAEKGEIPNTITGEALVRALLNDPYNADNIISRLGTSGAWFDIGDIFAKGEDIATHPLTAHLSEEDLALVLDWYYTFDIEGALAEEMATQTDEIRRLQDLVFSEYDDVLTRQEVKDLGVKLSDFKAAEHNAEIPISVTEDQYWLNKGTLSLDYIEEAIKTQASKPPLKWADMPEELTGKLENYITHVKTQMSDARYASTRFAEFKRDSALLNYNRRMNYNTYLGILAPYEFWFTQSLGKWALHSMDRPAMLSTYLRIKEFMNTAGGRNSNLPSRMKGQIRVRLPFVEKMAPWMGEFFIDPMRSALPFDTFFQFPEQYIAETRGIEGATVRYIEQQIQDGKISEVDGEAAIQDKSGDIWENARAIVESDREGKDTWDFMSLMISPHAPLTWAYEAATGTPEDIQPFTPLTRFSRAFSSLFGVQDFPLFPHNIEAKVRTTLGLPPFDKWEDYRVDRMLSNMAAMNEITTDEATEAMINREGEAFEEATRRADLEYGVKGTASFFGLPAQAFPEGERQIRSLADDYNKAYELNDAGALDALTNFWKIHPEWATRLALWKSPEEKLHRFLQDEIWDKYNSLPSLHRAEVRDQLGEEFTMQFLDKETASPEGIPIETLQLWSRLLSGENPGELSGEPRSLELAPPDIAYRAQTFYNTRNTIFPNYYELRQEYYDLPPGSPKESFREANPRIVNYWNWRSSFLPNWAQLQEEYFALPTSKRKGYLNQHPELGAFWDERRRLYPDYKSLSESYRNIKGIGQRQAFLQDDGQELARYWDWRNEYFHRNPEVVPYLSEEYELKYPTEKAQWEAEQQQPDYTWGEWQMTLSPPVSRLALDYIIGGEDLPDWAMDSLEDTAGNMGMDLATMFNKIANSYINQ